MSTKQKAYIALAITSIVWGTTWVAMKLGIKTQTHSMPALQLAAIRQFLGGVLFVIYFAVFKKKLLPTRQEFKSLLVLAIFTFVLANGLSTWSLAYIPSGLGALIGALYPLSVVLIEYFFYNNKNLKTLTVIGIVLGFLGIGVVFYENALGTHSANYFFGISLSTIAMLSWSYSTITITKQKVNANPYFGLGWQMIIGSVFMAILSLATHSYIPIKQIPATSWWAIAYLIVAGSIIAFVAFIYSMKHLPTPIATLYAYINPIIAIALGAAVLPDEHLTISILLGALITLTGIFLVNYSAKKQKLEEIIEKEL